MICVHYFRNVFENAYQEEYEIYLLIVDKIRPTILSYFSESRSSLRNVKIHYDGRRKSYLKGQNGQGSF